MKRMTMALAVALAFSLACAGSDTEPEEEEEEEVEEEEPEPEPKVKPGAKLQGSWQLAPSKESIRRIQVMAAAASEDARQIERLGDLTDEERELYKAVRDASASEKKLILSLVDTMKETRYVFKKNKVHMELDDEKTEPVVYKVSGGQGKKMTVTFEMGGAERIWDVTWKGPKRADVEMSSKGSEYALAYQLIRKD
jgi:outer membrane lipoprotein-sorting protein